MSEIKNGGQAFPNPSCADASGMTLRDYFAANAMQSFVQGATGMDTLSPQEVRRQFGLVGDFAYLMADAMLKAREEA